MSNKENFTMVETPKSGIKSKITIRPYFDAKSENMGLENRYVTGLNEFAPEVKKLSLEAKEAKIKEIRRSVAELEAELASNIISTEGKDFWNNVKLLKPDNSDFWNKIELSIDAKARPKPPKFYLDKEEETVSSRTEYKKMRNKALAELQKLFDKNSTKLFYVAKIVDATSTQYKKSTSLDVLYENMDSHIHGEGSESNMERAVTSFLDVVKSDMESLKIRSIVKDSIFFKYIITKSDGHIYHNKKNIMLGRNVSDIVEYLKNPLNEDVLDDLTEACEKYWRS